MKTKTILIIVITALITIILMKNTDAVEFWIFGTFYIQKLIILGTMFFLGIIVGFSLGRGSKKKPIEPIELDPQDKEYLNMDLPSSTTTPADKPLSDEDQNYIR